MRARLPSLLVFILPLTMTNGVADLRHDLQEIATREHIPAIAWVIKRPGEAAVISTIGSNITEATPFRFGSITKSFTAITLLKAAESREIPLTTPLDQVIPAREFASTFKEPLRLLDLVALTAGHTDIGFDAFHDNTAYPLTDALRRNQEALTSHWPPGLLHSYSNATPGLSERVIEVLTGRSYATALKELLFSPMSFKEATFENVSTLPGGFRPDGVTPIPYWNMTFKAFGGLNMSMRDMASFLSTLLQQGRFADNQIWSSTTHALLTTPAPSMATRAGLKIGYGAGMYSRLRQGLVWHGHGGDADGYRSRYAVLPDHDAAYAVVINTDNPEALVRMERLFEAELSKALAKPAVTTRANTAASPDFNGTYYPATVRFGREAWSACESPRTWLRAEKDQLFVRIGERRHTLISTGDNLFSRKGEHHAVMALMKDQDGVRWFVGELGNFVQIEARPPHQQSPVPPFLPQCLPE